MYYIWHIRAIPTYSVYQLYDITVIKLHRYMYYNNIAHNNIIPYCKVRER